MTVEKVVNPPTKPTATNGRRYAFVGHRSTASWITKPISRQPTTFTTNVDHGQVPRLRQQQTSHAESRERPEGASGRDERDRQRSRPPGEIGVDGCGHSIVSKASA